MRGDLAYWLHMQPSEIDRLSLSDFFRWHEQAIRVAKDYHSAP